MTSPEPNAIIPFSIIGLMAVWTFWNFVLTSWSPKRGGWIANQINAEHWIIREQDGLFRIESRLFWTRHGWYYGMDERFTFHSQEEAEMWIGKNLRAHKIHYTSEA